MVVKVGDRTWGVCLLIKYSPPLVLLAHASPPLAAFLDPCAALLRTAVRAELRIAIGYVDDTGTPSQRVLLPISLGGGMIRGHDPDDGRLRSYPLQRITTVSLLENE